MSEQEFKMPDVGEGIVEVEVIEWHVAVGDSVTQDQPLADVMTDKANVEISAPFNGTIATLACELGEMVNVGSALVTFQSEGSVVNGSEETPVKKEAVEIKPEAPKPAQPAKSSKPISEKPAPAPLRPRSSRDKVIASPAVRRKALEDSINLSQVPGTGSIGNVTYEDLEAFIQCGGLVNDSRQKRLGTQEIRVIGMRRAIAAKMQESKQTIPHFSYVEEIDLTDLEKLRQHLNATRNPEQPKLTILPFLMQALIKALEQFPQCNSTYDDQAGIVTQYDAVHIGLATQTDNGLKVPVAHHAESLSIWECADELSRLANAARDNTATPQELSGSSITITSLGKMGGIASTPVINKPEVSIIGVNKAEDRVVVRDGQMVIRKMMNLSSSFDHRIVDGFVAAQLIQAMKALLEYPATIFMQD